MRQHAIVIGNGTSRLQYDLIKLKNKFVTYGCNALYRDFIPDYLISIDHSMISEILSAKVQYKTKFYCQKTNNRDLDNVFYLDTINFSMDSGNHALLLACKNLHEKIYLLGFDYLTDGKMTNVYENTKNYGQIVRPVTIERTIQKRYNNLCKIISTYPHISFIRINTNNDEFTIDLSNFSQINSLSYE